MSNELTLADVFGSTPPNHDPDNALSDDGHAYEISPDKRISVQPKMNFSATKKRGRPANGDKLQRAVVHLPPGVVSALPDDRTLAAHLRAALALYVERLNTPTVAQPNAGSGVHLSAEQVSAIDTLCITAAQRQRLIELAHAQIDAPARDLLGALLKWYE